MPIPYWPKFASAEDAPNYQPTAGEDRCETCSYFRSLNDGSGYCERFSFQCEPANICDDFVMAGRAKIGAAPSKSLTKRLGEFFDNPVTKRVSISTGAGAAAGGVAGAHQSGEDSVGEGLRGAATGALFGSGIGLIGPAMRRGKLKTKFNADNLAATTQLEREIATNNAGMESLYKQRDDLKKTYRAYKDSVQNKGVSHPDTLAAAATYQNLRRSVNAGPKTLHDKIEDMRNVNNAKKVQLVDIKNKKVTPNLKEIASPRSTLERVGAPSTSALVGAGLGFGLSHDSKEQERFRKSKMK